MREVRMSLEQLLAEAQAAGGETPDGKGNAPANEDYLHVTLTDEHPQLDAMSRVREAFPNAMALDYDNIATLVHRDGARAAVDPDKMDTVALFASFYEEQVGKAMDDEQAAFLTKTVHAVEERHARGTDGEEGGAQ